MPSPINEILNEKISLSNLWTPIEECSQFKKNNPDFPNLYIKRDDFIGYIVGGNKIRKLEYVMKDVLNKRATTVITCGGTQSNHARVSAMVARRLGLKCVLVQNTDPNNLSKANSMINKMLGIEIHSVSSRQERDIKMKEVSEELKNKGENVYIIPLGSSNDIGSLGYVAAFWEMLQQKEDMGVDFNTIFISSSSGGTQAGLEIGKKLFNQNQMRICGISADDPEEMIKDIIMDVSESVLKRFNVNSMIKRDELCVDEGYFGEGYAIPTEASQEAARIFCHSEGILLDPVYTAKTASGLFDYCRKGYFKPDDNILFWHTGGLMALFS